MTFKPQKVTLAIWQGATYRDRYTWQDESGALVNLTGYTARLQMRASVASSAAFLELTTANGGITLGGAAGTIDFYASATATAAIGVTQGVYDLEMLAPNGDVVRLMEGIVLISLEVTR